jgi:hypothetical protein
MYLVVQVSVANPSDRSFGGALSVASLGRQGGLVGKSAREPFPVFSGLPLPRKADLQPLGYSPGLAQAPAHC